MIDTALNLQEERNQIYESLRTMYTHYVRHLLLSGIGVVVIAGIAVEGMKNGAIAADGTPALAVALLAPALCVSWTAGWAYLNVELWAYRHYMA